MSLPLIGTMIVAYLTAHSDEVTDLYTFVTAPPFLNLFTCLLVLVFGPGRFSVDYLVDRFLLGSGCCSTRGADSCLLPPADHSNSPQTLPQGTHS